MGLVEIQVGAQRHCNEHPKLHQVASLMTLRVTSVGAALTHLYIHLQFQNSDLLKMVMPGNIAQI